MTRPRLRLLVGVTLALAPAILGAQNGARRIAAHPRVAEAADVLKVWLQGQRDYEEIPGFSAAVVHDQEVLWNGGFGYADLARKTPATSSTLYSICSISKLFTAVGVMQLRDAGKLRLDDPVAKHLSWMKVRSGRPEAGEVTVQGILTHSSGLPRESDHAYWTGPEYAFPTREQIIERVSKQEMLYPAETYFQYSNLGLTLAGEIVAAGSGMSYTDYVRRSILDPLGMSRTFPEMPEQERGKGLAMGYSAVTREGNRVPVPFFLSNGIAPAAGYASTVDDLAKFAMWQFRALANLGGTEVLRGNTLREMHRVHWVDPEFETTYGLGFSVWRSDDKTFVGHGGSCPGFRSQLLLRPVEKLATVTMANAQGVNAQMYAQRIYDLFSPAVRAAVRDTTGGQKPADPSLDKFVGTYSSGFAGETAVVKWEGGLAMFGLPTTDPVRGMTKLRRSGDNVFHRVRRDETLGESYTFEIGPDGKATAVVFHNNRYRRVN